MTPKNSDDVIPQRPPPPPPGQRPEEQPEEAPAERPTLPTERPSAPPHAPHQRTDGRVVIHRRPTPPEGTAVVLDREPPEPPEPRRRGKTAPSRGQPRARATGGAAIYTAGLSSLELVRA